MIGEEKGETGETGAGCEGAASGGRGGQAGPWAGGPGGARCPGPRAWQGRRGLEAQGAQESQLEQAAVADAHGHAEPAGHGATDREPALSAHRGQHLRVRPGEE